MILHVTFVTENNGKIQVWYLGRIKNWATRINRKAPMKLPEPSSATEDFYMQHDTKLSFSRTIQMAETHTT